MLHARRRRAAWFAPERLEPRLLMSSSWWDDEEPADDPPSDIPQDTAPPTTDPAPPPLDDDDGWWGIPWDPPQTQPDTQPSTQPDPLPDPAPWQSSDDFYDDTFTAFYLTTDFSDASDDPHRSIYPDKYEWDDAPQQARPIATNWSRQHHTIHRTNDIDWVYFDVPVRAEVVVETEGNYNDDTEMWLFSGNDLNSAVAYDNNSGPGAYSRIAREGHKAVPPGRYFVAVASRRCDFIASYALRVEVRPRPDAWADPLFDEAFYRQQNPDVAGAIQSGKVSTGWDHFIVYGQFEGRQPSLYFDEGWYLSHNPDVAGAVARKQFASGWTHFSRYGEREARTASPYFDELQYRAANADVDGAVRAGLMRSGLAHFMAFGRYEGRDPSPAFSTQFYLAGNADIAGAFAAHLIAPYEHFVLHGQTEGRRPLASFSESAYLAHNPDIQWAVSHRHFRSGWFHWNLWGQREGRLV